jgi:hypothetical protein
MDIMDMGLQVLNGVAIGHDIRVALSAFKPEECQLIILKEANEIHGLHGYLLLGAFLSEPKKESLTHHAPYLERY